MRLRSCRFFLVAIGLLLPQWAVPASPATQQQTTVTLVGAFRVNIRSAPEIHPDTQVASLMAGTQLPSSGKEGDWYQVSLPGQEQAWVHADFARPGKPHPQLVILPKLVRIRQRAGLDSPILARAAAGLILQPLEKYGEWFQVVLPHPEGLVGWIREDLVEEIPLDPALKKIAEPTPVETSVAELRESVPVSTEEEAAAKAPAAVLDESPLTPQGKRVEPEQGALLNVPLDLGPKGFTSAASLRFLLQVLLGWSLFIAFVAFGSALLLPATHKQPPK